MVYIKFGIVFELFVYKIYGDSDGAFLCGTEILTSRLNEMDFSIRGVHPSVPRILVDTSCFSKYCPNCTVAFFKCCFFAYAFLHVAFLIVAF